MNENDRLLSGLLAVLLGIAFIHAAILGSSAVAAVPKSDAAEAIQGKLDIERLATELADLGDIHRIHRTLVVRIPDQRLFEADGRTLTAEGRALVSRIADDLARRPAADIYLRKYIDESRTDSKIAAQQELFLIKHELRKQGIDVARLKPVLNPPVETAAAGDLDPEQLVELRIVPHAG